MLEKLLLIAVLSLKAHISDLPHDIKSQNEKWMLLTTLWWCFQFVAGTLICSKLKYKPASRLVSSLLSRLADCLDAMLWTDSDHMTTRLKHLGSQKRKFNPLITRSSCGRFMAVWMRAFYRWGIITDKLTQSEQGFRNALLILQFF